MHKLSLLVLAATLSFLSFTTATPAQAYTGIGDSLGLSPYWDWKTIETEHFRLTFPKELSGMAQKAANYFEEADSLIAPKLHWHTIHKTQVLLIDNADSANGLTSPVARFGIVLYLTPPDNWYSTAYYENWLRLLCLHEYTHMVNMDTTRGIWSVLRYVFGDVFLPNSVWPAWMLEGLAVYMETRFTDAGRGRSPYYEMILRAAASQDVLDNSKFITLDKINGTNPYYPYGETIYTFGYQLWNQIARQNFKGITADGKATLPMGAAGHEAENELGEDSWRSGRRFPYFINGNIENISGKDWYQHWSEMVKSARERTMTEIGKIHSQPLSPIEVIPTTQGPHETWDTLGLAFSADGRWMAYTQFSSDEVESLYLLDRKSGELHQVENKISGAALSFTPDSKNLVFSTLNRKGVYYLWSDLKTYSVESGSTSTLSDSLRARDPDVSRDGNWITFTVSHDAATGLAIAPIKLVHGQLRMGHVKELFWPAQTDAVYTPKFSADGKSIYFSWHVNGKVGEQIASLDRSSGKVTVLASDGSMNRFPAVNPKGELYFVSDRTGVDNIYALRNGQAQLVSNTETGFRFPAFDSTGQLFADSYSYKGWQPAKVSEIAPIAPALVTIAPPPAPPVDELSKDHAKDEQHPIDDYSIFPSILPRQWAPLLLVYEHGFFAGGQVSGFDAVDRHRYLAGAAYDSLAKSGDYFLTYSNRSWGPDLTISAESYTGDVATDTNGNLLSYSRNVTYSADAEFPIQWTYSSLTPIVSIYGQRTFYKIPGANPSDGDTVAKNYWVPYADGRLVFEEAHTSRLAISTENGRRSELGARGYDNSGTDVVKGFAYDEEFWRTDFLMKHSVLVPSFVYSWVTHVVPQGFMDSNVVVEGRQSGRIFNSLLPQSLDHLTVRGYPLQTYYTRQAAVGSLDYRFPIAPIFRGWGTNPAFLDYFHGFVFGESAWFPSARTIHALPSAGGGLQADITLLNAIPITASTEYHKGFRDQFGGTGELFFQLGLNSSLPF